MKALVTGAAGFIGSNLAVALEAEGHDVVGLDDFATGSFENLKDFKGDFIAADFGDLPRWIGKVGKVDVVFHQAAITDTTVTDQKLMMKVNVESFRGLLAWAAESGVKKLIYASSAGVYGAGPVPMKETANGAPLNVYGFSKMVMERVAAEFQKANPRLGLIGLRYFNVFGPRERYKNKAASMIWQLAQQIKAGRRPRIFEHGEQYRDHIYVRDVVRANQLAAASKASGAFNVCTGKKTTFNEIIEFLNSALGTSYEPEYFKNPYSFYQSETLGDPGAAARSLKFNAAFTVESGIRDYFGGSKTPLGV